MAPELGNLLKEHSARLIAKFNARADRAILSVLPPDFSGQVLTLCREEALKVREEIVAVDAELARIEPLIAEIRQEVQAACKPVMQPARTAGDVLGEFEIIPPAPDPARRVVTAGAIEIQAKKLEPLQNWKERLTMRKGNLQAELFALRRVALLAGSGDVALLGYLSDRMRAKMVLSGFHVPEPKSKTPAPVASDSLGNELPPQAIDPTTGQADFSLKGSFTK